MNLFSLAIVGLSLRIVIDFKPKLNSLINFYMASFIKKKKKKQYYTITGLFFLIFFALLVIFVSSLLTTILSNLTPIYSDSMNLLIAILGIIIGTSLARRYFWPKPLLNMPVSIKKTLNYRTTKKTGLYNTLALVIFSFFATINTVGLSILLLSSYSVILGPPAIVWSLPFVIGLIIPLYFIIVVIALDTKVSAVIAWKENNKNTMRLCSGLIIILLSWLQLLIITTKETIVI